jgi:hypothetical protein
MAINRQNTDHPRHAMSWLKINVSCAFAGFRFTTAIYEFELQARAGMST